MPDVSITPNDLEQLQAGIDQWLGLTSKKNTTFKLTRAATSVQLSWVPETDVKLETRDRFVLIQVKDGRLRMNLRAFRVKTSTLGKKLLLAIESDPKLQHRSLLAAWRGIAETKHPAFVYRCLRFVSDIEEDVPSVRIDEASAARTDFEVVLDALSASPRVRESLENDPFAAAKLRGLRRKQQILEQVGGTFTSSEAADAIGITRQAVDKRRSSNQLLAITQGKRGYGYPRFQFGDGKTLTGLEEVLGQLKALDPWMQLIFFTTPNARVKGKSPIEVLRQGDSEAVIEAARGYGEEGAT